MSNNAQYEEAPQTDVAGHRSCKLCIRNPTRCFFCISYTDVEVAERMKITRAHVGNYRRQVLELLERAGLIAKYRGILAA